MLCARPVFIAGTRRKDSHPSPVQTGEREREKNPLLLIEGVESVLGSDSNLLEYKYVFQKSTEMVVSASFMT